MWDHHCVQFGDEGILFALQRGLKSSRCDRKIRGIGEPGHVGVAGSIGHNKEVHVKAIFAKIGGIEESRSVLQPWHPNADQLLNR